jgi:hypothetical protein
VPSAYFEEAGQRILSLVKLDELKSTDPANGFTVPANYFDELTGNVTSRINIDVEADAEHNGFALPANYFDQLTANITGRINIEMAEATEDNGFALPANYFEQLSNNINSRINIEAEAAEDMGYALPAGYFDELTSKIESRIAVEELANSEEFFAVPEGYFNDMQQQIAARIAVEEILAEKTTGFSVPDNYFEVLNRNILNKTVNKEVVIRKTIIRKLFASNSFKYATAACLALVIGTGVILQRNGTTVVVPESSAHQKTLLHSSLANVPVDEIKDYLEQNVDAGDATGMIQDDKQINTKALDDDLSDYIDAN